MISRNLAAIAALFALLALTSLVQAGDNANMNNSDTITGGGTQTTTVTSNPTAKSDATANAFSAAASKSSATLVNGNAATAKSGKQSQAADLSLEDNSNSNYSQISNYKRDPIATAASLAAIYCGGKGASVQTYNLGLSVSSRDYVCARLAVATAMSVGAEQLMEVRTVLALEFAKKGSKGLAVADAELQELIDEIGADSRAQIIKASDRLDQEDTKVGNFFRRVLGSLPILNFLAP